VNKMTFNVPPPFSNPNQAQIQQAEQEAAKRILQQQEEWAKQQKIEMEREQARRQAEFEAAQRARSGQTGQGR
jgi:hypothetical protein